MKLKSVVLGIFFAAFGATFTPSAYAVDGCKLLLCLAGNWRNIGECRGTVLEALRDLARGRVFPTCAMSGAGNSAGNFWTGYDTCPAMYRRYDARTGRYVGCTHQGAISVNINGALWSKVYWSYSGDTSTWYSDTARANLSQPGLPPLDDSFMAQLAAWNTQIAECQANGGTAVTGEYGAFERCDMPDNNSGG